MSTAEVLQRASATELYLQRVLDDVEQAPARAWLAEQDALAAEDELARLRRSESRPMFEVLEPPGADGAWERDEARWPEPFPHHDLGLALAAPRWIEMSTAYEWAERAFGLRIPRLVARPREGSQPLWTIVDDPLAGWIEVQGHFRTRRMDTWVSVRPRRPADRRSLSVSWSWTPSEPPPVEDVVLPARPDTEHLHFGRWTDPRPDREVVFPRLPGLAGLREQPPSAGPHRGALR